MLYPGRVKETTTTEGTGQTITLAGAASGFQTFDAALATDDYAPYWIVTSTGTWEWGVGHKASATTFSRDVVKDNSAGPSTPTDFLDLPPGTHTIFIGPTPLMSRQESGILVYRSTNQLLNTGAETAISWTSERYDTEEVATLPLSLIPIPDWVTKYQIHAQIAFDANGSGRRYAFAYADNASSGITNGPWDNKTNPDGTVSTYMRLSSPVIKRFSEASVGIKAYQDSGSSLNVVGLRSWLNIRFIE